MKSWGKLPDIIYDGSNIIVLQLQGMYKIYFHLVLVLLIIPPLNLSADEKIIKQRLKDVINVAHSSVSYFYNLHASRVMNEPEAKNHAKSIIKTYTFSLYSRYFYILNSKYKVIVHPTSEGKTLKPESPFNKIVKGALTDSEGIIVTNRLSTIDGKKAITTWVTYYKYFKPWDWIIVTSYPLKTKNSK